MYQGLRTTSFAYFHPVFYSNNSFSRLDHLIFVLDEIEFPRAHKNARETVARRSVSSIGRFQINILHFNLMTSTQKIVAASEAASGEMLNSPVRTWGGR